VTSFESPEGIMKHVAYSRQHKALLILDGAIGLSIAHSQAGSLGRTAPSKSDSAVL
jgi:hypothetical protein